MSEYQPTSKLPNRDILSRPLVAASFLDWEKITYAVFILVAIVTRFYDLGTRVVSHDESLHTQYSYQYYNGEGYQHTPLMHGPFLFHITAASFWLFGDNDFTSRIPIALFGIILVCLPYLLRDWIGKKGALFASFIFLISPYVTYYSRYIRHDIYVIVWAMIVFIATVYYLREPKEKYLWWFAAGLSMMFATKEVSFIYVAIFGSFMAFRFFAKVVISDWVRTDGKKALMPLAIVLLGSLLLVGGLFVVRSAETHDDTTETISEPVAADPNSAETITSAEATENTTRFGHFAQVAGFIILSAGVLMVIRSLRPHLQNDREFNLIMLYATLVLPTISAMVITFAGFSPRDYAINQCQILGQETMSPISLTLARLTTGECLSAYASSPLVWGVIITMGLLIASLVIGYWWSGRNFLISAAVFHGLFLIFYSSFFTNTANGWYSGMVGSLGYWLEQHDVQRGNQPWFYYLFVVPFYEFLPIIFSLIAIRYWVVKRYLNAHFGYLFSTLIAAFIGYSFVNWLLNRTNINEPLSAASGGFLIQTTAAWVGLTYLRNRQIEHNAVMSFLRTIAFFLAVGSWLYAIGTLDISGAVVNAETGLSELRDPTSAPGLLAALVVLALAIVGWFVFMRARVAERQADVTWADRLSFEELFGIIPHIVWWLILTAVAYSVAGEKMPWLSTHFVIPMAFLVGWYFNERLANTTRTEFFSSENLKITGLSAVVLLVGFLCVQTFLVDVRWGDLALGNLTNTNTFLGRLFTLGVLIALYSAVARAADSHLKNRAWLIASFTLLSFLTLRFTYLSSFVNADYTTEYLVYAHGAPGTKDQVLSQLEEVSLRLNGDKSVRVSFDDDSSWPMYWYLRDYQNRHFFGGNPSADILDSPVLIVGNDNWSEVDAIVRDDYEYSEFTYLWWPMEEYRKISWDSIFGADGDATVDRGMGSTDVRKALWDIFFYRDYDQYGNVFNINYDTGQWPLRDDLRIYIRRDSLSKLWDNGVTATTFAPPETPYAEGEINISALQTFGFEGSGDGQLLNPRNAAVAANGLVFVADTGNHRVAAFNSDGSFAYSFGGFSNTGELGLFNEPWSIATDDEYVYVADTWNNRVQKFTLDGEFVLQFGVSGIPAEGDPGALLFYGPRDIKVGSDGSLFITDTGNHRIQNIDANGNFIGQVGSQGFQLGELNEPTGIGIGPNGNVFVAEAWSERVQQFSPQFSLFGDWQVEAWDGNSLDNKPYLTIDNNGRIYATDPEGYQVLMFNVIGEYLGRFGRFGNDLTSFDLPTGITHDTSNNIYVVDTNNHRVMKFAAPQLGSSAAPSQIEIDSSDENFDDFIDDEIDDDVFESGGSVDEAYPVPAQEEGE